MVPNTNHVAQNRRWSKMTEPLTVFLADDQSLVRSGFRMLIDAEDDMVVVGEATNGLGAVTALTARPANVADGHPMPEMDGGGHPSHVAAGLPTKVLVLTTFDLDEYVRCAEGGGLRFHVEGCPAR